ncbi:DUF5808 domain-containing protein [Paenibacillus endoradicis]|uniref:DUF5808 domain-containing protein n=1 Tax=Paenibacillus endoradicis TaxID=2972487 RepID=UPI0021599379|nr:DUF5808 domain-containing protein [Paenibacillus endoradicis]MCR8659781.1 DUF5808 domain-containing protein [Paenibacillus endoradicis]
MLTVILSISAIICYIALAVTYKPQVKYKNGMLFAVTLPPHAMEHEEIHRIQARFNKQFKKASLWMVISFVPFLLLYYLMTYQFIYFFVWISVFCIVLVIPFRRAFRDTLALKRENEWFVGTKRVIQSDLRVALLKNQQSASLWLFFIPFTIAIGTMLWAIAEDIEFIGMAFVGLIVTSLFLLISLLMRGSKGKVYSENSEVNVALNQARRREISYLWIYMAIVENIHVIFIYLLLLNDNADMNGVWITMLVLFTVIPIGLIYYTYRNIGTLEQEVLAQDGKVIYSDDDEYWANGFTYHNPNDRSILVPKRIGMGETINTATVVGKLTMWGTVGLTAVLIIGVSFMLIRSELTSPVLTVTADYNVQIDYPMYSFDFNIADIEEITLVDEVPSGLKSNGESTNQYARGHFKLKEIGKTRLYIFKNNPPYIRVKLDDVYIFYNEKDPVLTKELFEQLLKL